MRKIILPCTLLVLTALSGATSATTSGGVVLAWTPADDPGEAVVYDVYGDGEYLGSTELTTFLAPAGFQDYSVRYFAGGATYEVQGFCFQYNSHPPTVGFQPC